MGSLSFRLENFETFRLWSKGDLCKMQCRYSFVGGLNGDRIVGKGFMKDSEESIKHKLFNISNCIFFQTFF